MPLKHRWTGRSEAELLARLRLQCYGLSQSEMPKFIASVTDDARCAEGEFLVVEQDGKPVGTAASLSLRMFARGAEIPCHGVAYVGTIRTNRRKAQTGGAGIATVVMQETIKRARDRGDVVTALMPFRASYYEHFGYGTVERLAYWTIPLSLVPGGDAGNFVHYEPSLFEPLVKLREQVARRGQCDVARPDSVWRDHIKRAEAGFMFVEVEGDPRSWVRVGVELEAGVQVLRVLDWGAATIEDFKRMLRFLGSLKDQYARVYLPAPIDYPVERMLKEAQLPHRPVAHTTASLTVVNRMQMRVLDHRRFLEALHWPLMAKGEAVVAIRECEGSESRLLVTVEHGRASVKASEMTPTFTTDDKTWAAVVSGEISASDAARFGLAVGAAPILDTLAWGPKPYCGEFF